MGLLALAVAAGAAQAATRVALVGVLGDRASPSIVAFRQALIDLGHEEGRSIGFEYRWTDTPERLRAAAAELVELKPDVILAPGTAAVLAARNATTTIPIVFSTVADPVGMGLVASLARPGGNVTGATTINRQLSSKRMQLLKQVAPKVSRVAHLYSAADPSNVAGVPGAREVARSLGIHLHVLPVSHAADVDRAFETVRAERLGAVSVTQSPFLAPHYLRIIELATRAKIPTIYGAREAVEAGGLMSYAANFVAQHRRAAVFVDKILRGASPAGLPVEQPTKFELVINMKTAKALGLTMQDLLFRADKVIE